MGMKPVEVPEKVTLWAGDAPEWPAPVLAVVRAKARGKGRASSLRPADKADAQTDYVRLERVLLGLGLPTQVTVAGVLLGLPGISAFGQLRGVLAGTDAATLTDGTLRDNLASARRLIGLAARSRGPNVPVELVDPAAFRAFLRWVLSRQPPQVRALRSGAFYVAEPTASTVWAHPGEGGRTLPAHHVTFRLHVSRDVDNAGPGDIRAWWEVIGGPGAVPGRPTDEDDVHVHPADVDSRADGGGRLGAGSGQARGSGE